MVNYAPIGLSQDYLTFNTTGQPPLNTDKHDGFMDVVMREALGRIGYRLVIDRLPAERGLRSANRGLVDGEMSRIKGIDKIYKNLIRVPEKIMDWEFIVISEKPIDLQQSWQSLSNKNVAFITGWKILETNVPKSAFVTKTKNSQQLFTLLGRNRTEYIIYERWGGSHLINKLRGKGFKLRFPPLAAREMFIYLHKKHGYLVPRLNHALIEMKKDGTYKKFEKQYLENTE